MTYRAKLHQQRGYHVRAQLKRLKTRILKNVGVKKSKKYSAFNQRGHKNKKMHYRKLFLNDSTKKIYLNIPHRVIMTLVANKISIKVCAPQPNYIAAI